MLITFFDANSAVYDMDRDRAIAVFVWDVYAFYLYETSFFCKFKSVAVQIKNNLLESLVIGADNILVLVVIIFRKG